MNLSTNHVLPLSSDTLIYTNPWGDIFDRVDLDCVEARWFDTTTDISVASLREFLLMFATVVEKCRRRFALVDANQFRVAMERSEIVWRNKYLIPRYNAAGIKAFAFIMPNTLPPDAPILCDLPLVHSPAVYPTRAFGTRREALTWLKQQTS